jgi:predicted site-specific integrase-resolvase
LTGKEDKYIIIFFEKAIVEIYLSGEIIMSKYISIGKVAEEMAVSTQTIRNWEKEGYFKDVIRTFGGHRRFNKEDLYGEDEKDKKTIIYSRVSSHDQKADLKRQTEELKEYCEKADIENIEILEDIGSGINYKKRGLKKLISKVVLGKVKTIVINFQDRLLRFGMEMLEQICELNKVDIIIVQ